MTRNFNILLVGTGGQGVIVASNILGWAALKTDGENKVRTAETHGMAQRGGTVIVHLRFGPTVESPLVKTSTADVILAFELAEAIRYINYLKLGGILLVNDESIIPPVLFRGKHVEVNRELCIGCGNCKMNCLINTYYQDPKSLAVINSPSSRIINGKCKIISGCTGCMSCLDICSQNAIQLVEEISYPLHSDIERVIKHVSNNGFIIPASKIAVELGDIRMTNIVMLGALLGFNSIPLKFEVVEQIIGQILNSNVVKKNLEALKAGRKIINEFIKR